MWRIAISGFAVAHGLVHAAFLSPPPRHEPGEPAWPFHLDRSWLLSRLRVPERVVRALGILLVGVVVFGFLAAGVGLLAGFAWWPMVAVVSAVVSFVQLGLYFHPWLSLGLAINAAIVAALVWGGWPPATLVGP